MDQDERHATPDDEGRHAGSSSRAAVQSAQRRRDDRQDASGGLKLFTKRPGEPYLFFVQVEIRNRAKIADPIKVRCPLRSPGVGSVKVRIYA